jgi:F-type H+-transporting ATPase subunit alpha
MPAPTILSAHDDILRVGGLPECMLNEQLVFADGSSGWALRLEEDAAVVALLDRGQDPHRRGAAATTGRVLQTPTGPALLGRVVDPLGRPLDGRGPVPTTTARRLDPPAPGLAETAAPAEALSTGVKFLDALYPMRWGQSRATPARPPWPSMRSCSSGAATPSASTPPWANGASGWRRPSRCCKARAPCPG